MINLALYLSSLVLFTVFDIVGYRDVGKFVTGKEPNIIQYRVMQGMFQGALATILTLVGGPYLGLAFLMAWWLLVCDVLYYLFLGIKLEPFSWFLINPFVFISNKIFKEPAPVYLIVLSATIGLLGGLFIVLSL